MNFVADLDGTLWRSRHSAVIVAVGGLHAVLVASPNNIGPPHPLPWLLGAMACADGAMDDRVLCLLADHRIPFEAAAADRTALGPIVAVTADTVELKAPIPCPHGNAVGFGGCPRSHRRWLEEHREPHRVTCGCVCSGLIRRTHRSPGPIRSEHLPDAARLTGFLLAPPTGDPWWWWDRFCERAASKPPTWLSLWVTLARPQRGDTPLLDEVDALCDAALP